MSAALVLRLSVLTVFGAVAAPCRQRAQTPAADSGDKIVPRAAASSSANSEIFKTIRVEPGKTVPLDSEADYSEAGTVAVSLRSSADSPADLSDLELTAYWSVPEAEKYNATEMKSGKDLAYTTTGGVIFQVCGSQFRLVLTNSGEKAIVVLQVIVYRRPP